jgi:UrcA family protein
MRKFLSAALLLSLLPAAALAETWPSDTPPTAKVQYRDLDLRTEKGERRLRTRVREAAIAVCAEGGYRQTGLLWTPSARKCQDAAIATAETRVELAVAHARDTRLASVDPGEFSVAGNSGR